ncbi:MAG: chemotaxis protein CheA, partial [Mangrovicoccus sp.]
FAGDDPLRMALAAPQLLWMELTGLGEQPDLSQHDPFLVTTGFRLVSGASAEELAEHFRYVDDQVEISALGQPQTIARETDIDAMTAAALIETQRRLIASDSHGDFRDAALGSAQEVLRRIARHEGSDIAEQLGDEVLEAAQLDEIAAELLKLTQAPAPPEPASGSAPEPAPDLPPQSQIPNDTQPQTQAPPPPASSDSAAKPETPSPETTARKSTVLRVDAERIDTLMNLTGELIVAKNAMPFLARKAEEIEGARELLREIKMQYDMVNRITEELQTAVMQIRMVPVGSVLGRFNRLVRDLSRKLGKQITLETSGEETEADKAVVEELSDPLVHLIRNAIDHGLEPPDERRAADKPETGLLRLHAFQRDDAVIIEVSDDGRGIALDGVKAKALERGIVDQDA